MGAFRANLDAIAATPVHPRHHSACRAIPRARRAPPRRHYRIRRTPPRTRTVSRGDRADCAKKAPTPPICRSSPARSGERIAALAASPKTMDAQYRELLAGVPNMPHESVSGGQIRGRQCGGPHRGRAAGVRFRTEGALGHRPGTGHSRLRARRQNHRAQVCRLLRARRASWSAR